MTNFIKNHAKFLFAIFWITLMTAVIINNIEFAISRASFDSYQETNKVWREVFDLDVRTNDVIEKLNKINTACAMIRLENAKYSSSDHPDVLAYRKYVDVQ